MEMFSIQEARDLLMSEASFSPSESSALASAAEQYPSAQHESLTADESALRRGGFAQAEARGQEEASTAEDAAEEENKERSYAQDSVGLGIDIVEIARMKNILLRQPSFAERVFSEEERAYCESKASPATHYALRFAAKEAVVKALGTGFAEGIGVLDIEVEREQNGKPSVKLRGRALELAEEAGINSLSLSMSYTHAEAVACAMAITEASIQASEKRKDPMEELARQFKETRKMLDEI